MYFSANKAWWICLSLLLVKQWCFLDFTDFPVMWKCVLLGPHWAWATICIKSSLFFFFLSKVFSKLVFLALYLDLIVANMVVFYTNWEPYGARMKLFFECHQHSGYNFVDGAGRARRWDFAVLIRADPHIWGVGGTMRRPAWQWHDLLLKALPGLSVINPGHEAFLILSLSLPL